MRLWVALDAGRAGQRNIYTVLPDGTMVRVRRQPTRRPLAPYLRTTDAAALIDFIRSQPLGAIVGSTPAFLDAPSLDPPPDADYPGVPRGQQGPPLDDLRRRQRRHAARHRRAHSGIEVWAFIPVQPAAQAARCSSFGQPVDDFNYFVDSSPKIADVKVGSEWRTYLFFGQGPGGTFYNTLRRHPRRTWPGRCRRRPRRQRAAVVLLVAVAHPAEWSFPRNSGFDWHARARTATSAAGALGRREDGRRDVVRSRPSARCRTTSAPFVMFVGSGFLKYRPAGAAEPRAASTPARRSTCSTSRPARCSTREDVGARRARRDHRQLRASQATAADQERAADGPGGHRSGGFALHQQGLHRRPGRQGLALSFILNGSGVPQVNGSPQRIYDAAAAHPLFSSMATVNVGISHCSTSSSAPAATCCPRTAWPSPTACSCCTTPARRRPPRRRRSCWNGPTALAGDEKVTAFPGGGRRHRVLHDDDHLPDHAVRDRFSANLYAFTFIGGPAYDTNGDGQDHAPDHDGRRQERR